MSGGCAGADPVKQSVFLKIINNFMALYKIEL